MASSVPITYYHQQVLLLREQLYARAYPWERVRLARMFIDEHYGASIDVDAMAREACLSKFHFIRLFRSFYGRTPYQYLTEVRIRRARVLLQEGMAVADVCLAVGFASVTSFMALFRKMAGVTPYAYQQRRFKN